MGCLLSKSLVVVAPAADIVASHHGNAKIEPSSYETMRHEDPNIQSFDATIQQRTSSTMSTLADGIEVHALSMDTLQEVTDCLLDMGQEVVNVVLECKDISKSPEIFELAEDYFDNSLQTLDFCSVLGKCLKKARNFHIFGEELQSEDDMKGYERTLEELRHFKSSADPFTQDFFGIFQSVYMQQVLMLQKLQGRNKTLDKKLKKVKSRRRISRIIFVSAFAAVIICSVVAAALVAPPVAGELAAAAAVPFGSAGKSLDSFWSKCSRTLKRQKEVLSTMQVGNSIAIKDLGNICALVDGIDFATRGEEFGIEEMKKLEVFMKSIENLGEQTEQCNREGEDSCTAKDD